MATANWNGRRLRPTFDTEQDAIVWGKEQEARMAKGLDITEPSHMQERGVGASGRPATLLELWKWTCEHRWKVDGPDGGPMKSAAKLMLAGKQCVEALGANTKFRSLDFYSIERGLEMYRQDRGNQPATTNRRKAALSVMFKQAEKLYPDFKRPVVEKKRETNRRSFRILPDLEDAMLQWALARGLIDFYDTMVLCLYLGQRENEILRLRFSESTAHPKDGFIDDGFAVFPEQSVANKSTFNHAIPLRPIVQEVIARRAATAEPRDRVLTSVTKGKIDYWWRTMREELIEDGHPDVLSQKREGCPLGKDFVVHIMRHEFCSRLGDEGYNLHEIAQYSGHSTPAMCKRYVKPHKVAHRNRLLRAGKIETMNLPGGAVPEYAPNFHPDMAAAWKRTAHAPLLPQSVGDADAMSRLMHALQIAGLTDLFHKAVAGSQSVAQ